MARLLLEAICGGEESHAHDLILDGTYGCVDSQTSRRDGTALFFCCSRGYLQLAQMLLARGASVHAQNRSLATPLHAAADQGHVDIVKLLICHHADVNARTHRGDTPLHLAAFRGHTEVIHVLVKAGADSGLLNAMLVTAEVEARSSEHTEVSRFLRAMATDTNPSERNDEAMLTLDPPKDTPRGTPRDTSRDNHYLLSEPCESSDLCESPMACDTTQAKQFMSNDASFKHKSKQQSHTLYKNMNRSELSPSRRQNSAHSRQPSMSLDTAAKQQQQQQQYNNNNHNHSSEYSRKALPALLSPHGMCVDDLRSRRPSTSSNCSLLSEASVGSDVASMTSDASGGDSRREEPGTPEYRRSPSGVHGVHVTQQDHAHNRLPLHLSDVFTNAAVVKNASAHHATTKVLNINSLQQKSGYNQGEFASIYDSSLFNISSMADNSLPYTGLGLGITAHQHSRDSSMSSRYSLTSSDASSVSSFTSSGSDHHILESSDFRGKSNSKRSSLSRVVSQQYLAPPSSSAKPHHLRRTNSAHLQQQQPLPNYLSSSSSAFHQQQQQQRPDVKLQSLSSDKTSISRDKNVSSRGQNNLPSRDVRYPPASSRLIVHCGGDSHPSGGASNSTCFPDVKNDLSQRQSKSTSPLAASNFGASMTCVNIPLN